MGTKPTKEELIQAVFRIINADGSTEELDGLLAFVEGSVPHPSVSDLIYHPCDGVELSAEEIVEIALGYKPIELGEGTDGQVDERKR